MHSWCPGELRERAIALRAEIDGPVRAVGNAENRFHEHSLANALRCDTLADSDNSTAGVCSLDARKDRRRAGPTGVLGTCGGDAGGACLRRRALRFGSGIPCGARVDVGIVHACSADADQDLAGARHRYRHVLPVLELLESAVTLE